MLCSRELVSQGTANTLSDSRCKSTPWKPRSQLPGRLIPPGSQNPVWVLGDDPTAATPGLSRLGLHPGEQRGVRRGPPLAFLCQGPRDCEKLGCSWGLRLQVGISCCPVLEPLPASENPGLMGPVARHPAGTGPLGPGECCPQAQGQGRA